MAIDKVVFAAGTADFYRVGTAGGDFRFLELFGDVGRVVVLAEHLHVATQGENADAVFGFAPLAAELVAADVEADHEFVTTHAAGLCHQEVTQLMDEDHGAQADPHDQDHAQERGDRTKICNR